MPRSLRVDTPYIEKAKLAVKRSGFPSQQALAEDAGLSLATVSKFLTGRPVDRATFAELCEKLSLDYNEIAIFDTESRQAPIAPLNQAMQEILIPEWDEAKDIAARSAVVLEEPEGQVPLSSPWYVERPPIEADCYEAVVKPGTLIRIKAPRQMGKTSLISRVLNHARQQGYQSIYLSFQSADGKDLKDLDSFLRWICFTITDELNLPLRLNDYWKDDFLGIKHKCTNYVQRYLLTEIKTPIALGLDEVDEVFKYAEVAPDFFGLLRTWHERAKNNSLWQKLRLVIAHSKEVYIPLDINQSPFNVGLPIELRVLTPSQVQDLVHRHGLNWTEEQPGHLMTLLGGHPYLVRVALYQIARGRMTLEQLQQMAPTEEGPYSDHLRRHLLNLQETKDSGLLAAARQVMSSSDLVDVGATEAFKLCSMGLVKLRGNEVMPLCELYRQYFGDRLRGLI